MTTNADITIYNRWYDSATRSDRWLRTQIRGVSWYGGQAVTVGEKGLLSADVYTVRIPLISAPSARRYVSPSEWAAAKSSALAGLWTFQAGDAVVYGLSSAAAPPKASEKTRCFVVTGVSENLRGGSPHWKVTGK